MSYALLMPAAMVFAVQSTRAAMVIAVSLWIASHLAATTPLFRSGRKSKSRVLAGVAVFFFRRHTRFGLRGPTSGGKIPTLAGILEFINTDKAKAAFLGEVPAFCEWFDSESGDTPLTWSQLTFAGPVAALGIRPRAQASTKERWQSAWGQPLMYTRTTVDLSKTTVSLAHLDSYVSSV